MKKPIDEQPMKNPVEDDSLPVPPGDACDAALSGTGECCQKQGRPVSKRERRDDDQPTPLAFVINSDRCHPDHSVTAAKWSEAAFGHLESLDEALRKQSPRISLPVVSLRGRLELADQSSLRLDRNVGRQYSNFPRTLLWTQTDPQTCLKATNDAVLGWLVNDVVEHAQSEAAKQSAAQLQKLARTQQAVEVAARASDPFRWETSLGKTAKATSPSSYVDLADYVARQLEGKAVFPELLGLRRIAGGQLDQNQAELITEPIPLSRGGHFSLVVRVRVFSYPGRTTPLVVVEFSRRVWTRKLKETFGAATTISGYAFPPGSTRALRFTLRKSKGEDGVRAFQPDADFAPIERHYFAGAKLTTDKILKHGHRLPECKLLVALKHGTGERSEVKSGVPDLDKMDGFLNIAGELASIGLTPWQGLELIETSTRPAKDNGLAWRKRDSEKEADRQKYAIWLQEAQESIRACYAGEHHIIIAVQQRPGVEADALRAETRLKEILQGSVITTRVPISPLVHGPKNELPGKELKQPAERAALRSAEWSAFIQTVKQYEARTGRKVDGVLVIAHEWYPGRMHDDNVNMHAARVALAVGLGAPVQYLLPSEELPDSTSEHEGGKPKSPVSGDEAAESFEMRLMMAWLDLAYKSLGRVRPSKIVDEARKLYGNDTLFEAYPDRVLALGVVRRNKSKFLANERSFLPYAIELDTETGVCTASFAYEDAATGNLALSDPLPLPQALVKLAGLGPVQLTTSQQGERKKRLQERTQAFFKARLADFGQRGGLNPLVIIDADTCRSVWPWLTDALIDPNNVHLAGGFNAQAAWKHVRMVRIRTDNSPKVLWGGEYCGSIGNTEEVVRYQAPKWAEAQLFKLNDTANTNVYLSFGSAIRRLLKGTSSYRRISGIKMKVVAHKQKFETSVLERHNDAWTTPTGLEVFVVRSGSDEPNRVAAMVEWLRQCYPHIGGWTLKPAPLHFEHALKEYIADYDLDEDEVNVEDDE